MKKQKLALNLLELGLDLEKVASYPPTSTGWWLRTYEGKGYEVRVHGDGNGKLAVQLFFDGQVAIRRNVDSRVLLGFRAGIQESELRSKDIRPGMESRVRPKDRGDQRKKIVVKGKQLPGIGRDRQGREQASQEGRSFHKVRKLKKRTRILR